MLRSVEVSILIPTYNEALIINDALRALASELGRERCQKTEILIVDDGVDDLPQVVQKEQWERTYAHISVIRNAPPLGKCASLAQGFEAARGKIVGFIDVDLSTPLRYYWPAESALVSGQAELSIASRRAKGAVVTRKQHWLKDVLSKVLNSGINHLLFLGGRSYPDTQCGFKFFKNDVAKILYRDLSARDGIGDLEVMLRANALGFRVHEQPVVWTDVRESKRSLKRILMGEVRSLILIVWRYKIMGLFTIADLKREWKAMRTRASEAST